MVLEYHFWHSPQPQQRNPKKGFCETLMWEWRTERSDGLIGKRRTSMMEKNQSMNHVEFISITCVTFYVCTCVNLGSNYDHVHISEASNSSQIFQSFTFCIFTCTYQCSNNLFGMRSTSASSSSGSSVCHHLPTKSYRCDISSKISSDDA